MGKVNQEAMVRTRGYATAEDKRMLFIASKVIGDRKRKRHSAAKQRMLFAAVKVWSTRDDEKRAGLTKILRDGKGDVTPEVTQAMIDDPVTVTGDCSLLSYFNKPLMDDCAYEKDPMIWFAWGQIKRTLLFFAPRDLQALEKELAETPAMDDDPLKSLLFPLPEWLKKAGPDLRDCSKEDSEIKPTMNYWIQEVLNGYGRRQNHIAQYAKLADRCRLNVIKMNTTLSVLGLYNFLCEKVLLDKCTGAGVVAEFFRQRQVNHEKLERYCQVMDIEGKTIRSVIPTQQPEGEPTLEYHLDEGFCVPDRDEEEISMLKSLDRWLSKVFVEMRCRRIECNEETSDQIVAFMERICLNGMLNGAKLALLDWKLDTAYFDE